MGAIASEVRTISMPPANSLQYTKVKELRLLMFGLLVFLYALVVGSFTFAESFIFGYQIYLLLRFINSLGNLVCFFDFLCFYSALDTLLMPMAGYRIYNASDPLTKLWGWYMRVPEDVYYSFLIPSNLALFFGVNTLIAKYKTPFFKDLLQRLAVMAKDKGKVGIVLTIIGFLCGFLDQVQSSLAFVFHLLAMLKYVGPLYIYFSDLPFRKKALYISIGVFLAQSVLTGMFGEFVMYSALVTIILAIKFNLKFSTKLLIMISGLFGVIVLQSVKGHYRSITWRGKTVDGLSTSNSSQIEIFGTLLVNNVTNFDNLFDKNTAFPIYTRMNQGYLIPRAMDYVPRVEPYAEGETILRTIGAVLVPRFLWPDKMESGGYENLSRFLGIKRRLTYSMNIGPYGEAYGNFGPVWGVLFIFVFGLFLSLLYSTFLKNCNKRPTLLLWAPLLFYYTLTVETDILSTLNAFIKGAVFVALVFWAGKKIFSVSL